MASIQGVYVALFGRPADPTGLAFFNTATNNGGDLSKIGDLAASQEYKDRFAGQSNVQIVNSIYKSLFNRDAEAGGLTFFVNALNTGELNINNIAIAILDGAQGTDKTTVETKIAAADAFTAALDTGPEIVGYDGAGAAASARAFLAAVTTTAPTAAQVDAAVKAAIDTGAGGGGVVGQTFTLTVGADSLSPTAAVAANKTTANDDTFRAPTANSLETVDLIDGGDGVDTLTASLAVTEAAGTDNVQQVVSVKPVLRNIEKVFLDIDLVGGAGDAGVGLDGVLYTFDAGDSSGIKELWSSGSSIAGNGANTNSTITFAGVSKDTTVGLQNTSAALTVNFAGASGAADAATIALSAVTTNAAVSVAAIETLTVNSTGSNNSVALTAADATSVILTGDKVLVLGLTGANVTTIDGSAMTAAANVTYTAGSALTAKGGSGADTFNLNTATAKVTIDTGAGADTVNINAAKAHSITLGGGSDTVNVLTTGAGNQNVTADSITTAAKLEAAAVVITDFAAGDKINVDIAAAADLKVLSGTQLAEVAGESTLLAALNSAITKGAVGQGDQVWFHFADSSYIFINEGGDAALNAGDSLIKVAGIHNFTATDLAFV